MAGFLEELKWRGLFHQCTDEAGLSSWLADPARSPRRAYVGFDPTADSLTIGNLVPIMMLKHFQLAGHQPVVVMGGGTGLIGDPSGKSAERQLMTREQVEANVESQKRIFSRLLDMDLRAPSASSGSSGRQPALMVNNLDWLGKLSFLEVLRDVGKHFSVNMMIQKDSVRERLHSRDQGISYTEFSYMVLQAFDFMHLFFEEQVGLQMGGSDQWGNIVAGLDLVRGQVMHTYDWSQRFPSKAIDLLASLGATKVPVGSGMSSKISGSIGFGVTAPLVTKADGGKFGKTEAGAIWLSSGGKASTSPYAYYQFWLNAADADVGRYLRIFTLLSQEQIAALEDANRKDPGAREAQRTLAREATTLLHGPNEMAHAEQAAKALFTGDLAGLPAPLLEEVLAAAPSSRHDKAQLSGEGVALLEVLPQTTLAKSKSEARELLSSGSVTVNGAKVGSDHRLTTRDLLHGSMIALRRGKKTWHLTRWG